jgi:septum formation protein
LSASEVRFRATTRLERLQYCATGEPFDKAGGYGIQGHAAVFIEELRGSYSGVVGLPLFETAALLTHCGLDFWLTARAA